MVFEDAIFSLPGLKSHFISFLLLWAETFDVGEDSFVIGLMCIPDLRSFVVFSWVVSYPLFCTCQTCLCIFLYTGQHSGSSF